MFPSHSQESFLGRETMAAGWDEDIDITRGPWEHQFSLSCSESKEMSVA